VTSAGVGPRFQITGTLGRKPDPPHYGEAWHEAYMAALFEPDREKMADNLKYAERLIIQREREIFAEKRSTAERKALDKARHALGALRLLIEVTNHSEAIRIQETF
jgi:hypothetical protein